MVQNKLQDSRKKQDQEYACDGELAQYAPLPPSAKGRRQPRGSPFFLAGCYDQSRAVIGRQAAILKLQGYNMDNLFTQQIICGEAAVFEYPSFLRRKCPLRKRSLALTFCSIV